MASADQEMLDGLAHGASYAGTVAAVDEGHATVMVLLPTVDGGSHRHGPCPYQHSVDGLAPRVGEGCLVVEDEGGGLWVASRALDRGWSIPDRGPGSDTQVFVQSAALAVWTIPYGSVYPPAVTVTAGGLWVLPDLVFDETARTVTATFGGPTSGRAYLS